LAYVSINRAGWFLSKMGMLAISTRARAALLVLAFAGLLFAHDPIAYGVYNAGVNDKMETARRVNAALDRCCSLSTLVTRVTNVL